MATSNTISDTSTFGDAALDGEFEYRPLSTAAIASAVFGVISLLMFIAGRDSLESSLMLSPIPIVGLAIGLKALAAIRAAPDQLGGRKAALVGTLLSAFGLVGGLGYAGYVHATEVPDGYTRISFLELRPDEVDRRSGEIVPKDIKALDGKKVFIKGYIRPGTTVTRDGTPVRRHAGRFLLVRDNNQCCFGDKSKVKYYDQVLVDMAGLLTADDSRRLMRVGGVLHSNPEPFRQGLGQPVYTLEADYLQ